MKAVCRILVALVSVSLFSFAAAGQASEVRKIDAYAKTVGALAKKAGKPDLIFADTSDYEESDRKPAWRRFESEEELTKFREETKETYALAFVWQRDGKPVLANFTIFSPSGDWAQYDFHYFRADGSVAKIESELRTFYGEFSLKRDVWFSAAGKQISSRRGYYTLETGKPIRKPKVAFETEIDRYKRATDLPFYSLLPKGR